jgi:hypothetical protein
MKRKRTTVAKRRAPRRTATKRPTVRRRTTRKKGFLSEMFNPMQAQASAKVLISGAIGGVGAGLLSKIYPQTTTPQMKALYTIAGGFIASVALKMPNVGAGMAGVGVHNLLQSQGMLAEGEYSYANELEALPMVLNEGEAQYLAEDYLSEDYLSEDEENEYQVPYAPAYGGF